MQPPNSPTLSRVRYCSTTLGTWHGSQTPKHNRMKKTVFVAAFTLSLALALMCDHVPEVVLGFGFIVIIMAALAVMSHLIEQED